MILEDFIAALPCWSGPIELAPLDGGMTNRNYRVRCAGQQFAVRLGHDLPEHGVMRFNELAAARAAHAAGISPAVVFAGDGVLVSRFIEGRSLSAHDLREPRFAAPVLDLLRRCHHELPLHLRGPVLTFWVFQVIRHYAGVLRDARYNPLADRLAALSALALRLEQAVGPIQLVFGHNDLLAANFIDDGRRLWLIDWDYAGFNSPLFDLANLSSNNEFSAAQDRELLTAYFEIAPEPACWRSFMAMKTASLLREALWGAVSQLTSSIDFDYASYTRGYLARLDAAPNDF